MTGISIQRTSEYINSLRNCQVWVDDEKVGAIANGETKVFPVSPGQHVIKVTIDWAGSPDLVINLAEDEVKSLKVGGFQNSRWLFPTAVVLSILHYIIYSIYHVYYILFLLLPVFLLLLYYLTIGRRKYLTITELRVGT